MMTFLPVTALQGQPSQIMGLDILGDGSAALGCVTRDSPRARRWRAKSTEIGGFRHDVTSSNDLMIPMTVKTADLGIRLGDDTAATDAAEIAIGIFVVDSETATESVTVQIGIPVLAVDDDIAVEAVTVQIGLTVLVFDDDVAVESAAVVLSGTTSLSLAVSDDAPATEVVTVQIPMAVSVTDDETSAESATVTIPMQVVAVDSQSASESVSTAFQPLNVVVFDDDVASELAQANSFIPGPAVTASVFDDERRPAMDAEWVSVVIQEIDLTKSVGDDLNETEAVMLSLGDEPVESTGCGMVWEAQP